MLLDAFPTTLTDSCDFLFDSSLTTIHRRMAGIPFGRKFVFAEFVVVAVFFAHLFDVFRTMFGFELIE
jgi:hypothetical protein